MLSSLQSVRLSLLSEQQYDAVCRNALLTSCKAKAFLGGCLDADGGYGNTADSGNILTHLVDVGRKLRLLCKDYSVEISHGIAVFVNELHHMPQKLQTVRPLVTGIGVGEMLADVAQCKRTKQGIGNRMQQDIRIGMSQKSEGVRKLHAAEKEVTSLHKIMHIVSMSDSDHNSTSAIARSSGVVSLILV